MDKKLLDVLACPVCTGKLQFDSSNQRLICRVDRLAFPVRDGIPVMLEDQAEPLNLDAE